MSAALNALGNLFDPPRQVATLQSAHGFDPLYVGRLPLGQFDDQVVAEHPPRGLIAAAGLFFPPLPQFVDNRQAPRIETRIARYAPPALVGHRMAEGLAPRLPLLLEPSQAAEFHQQGVDAVADEAEIINVLGGVVQLAFGERSLPPISAGLVLLHRLAQQLQYQRAVSGRILDARQPGRKLTVKEFFRLSAGGGHAELHLASAGVDDRFLFAVDNRLPEGQHVGYFDRINDRQVLRRTDLDQAEFGPIAALGDELRIQRDPAATGKLIAELA